MNQAIFEPLSITPDATVTHEYGRPVALLLGEDVERAVTKRYLLTADESAGIDEEWRHLAAKWAAELARCCKVRKAETPSH